MRTFLLFSVLFTLSQSASQTVSYELEVSKQAWRYSAAAYCVYEDLEKWDCGRACEETQGMLDVQMVRDADRDTFAYVGYDNSTGKIVIAFRGTNGAESTNWITNIKTDFDKYPNWLYPDAGVHSGFYTAYKGIADNLKQAVQRLRDKYDYPEIMVTGHSMGGALALLGVLDLRTDLSIPPENITFYTFGQPRVGGENFRDYVYFVIGQRYFRVIHEDDMVPHLPSIYFSFRHAGIEVWYTDQQDSEDYKICVNYPGRLESHDCSNQYSMPTGVDVHTRYMGVELSEMCKKTQAASAPTYRESIMNTAISYTIYIFKKFDSWGLF
ncbi:hypothetical protein FGO68_gene8733 [Halteria grandinella]|uniref:Fungal lipase-type domain-containing protein n=1 Tax=Halteria grandinella TaxID=5974 RepID=A0A8J8NKG6_HALGN|nr:hypothetical protein FGO68_gene8733 [Halteria grandinella]